MRGKDSLFIDRTTDFRITPAYAGKSEKLSSTAAGTGDHPRLCGEKGMRTTKASPDQRITPAYAGKRARL